jgi:L,D-peptidoglycan transpeptidase YkuD (ErfK/YbiS/YcfS/YnhG family)
VRWIADSGDALFGAEGGACVPCRFGRSGVVPEADKREGDGASPVGEWPILAALLRPDRVVPMALALPWRWLRPDDGWSDGPADPAYNRPVRHPYRFSAERLWREDGLYDAIVVLGHNMGPPEAGRGSAIFLHCWREGATTEGCVALAKPDLLAVVPSIRPGDTLVIV